MTFEYIVDKQTKKLSNDQSDYVIKRVTGDFKEYNSHRSKNISMAESLSDEIFYFRVTNIKRI